MSTEPSSFPVHTEAAHVGDPVDDTPVGDDESGIRQQAAEITEAVLSGSAPGQAASRDRLRKRPAAHQDRPEAMLGDPQIALRPLIGIRDLPPRKVAATPQQLPGSPGSEPKERVRSRIETVLQDRMLVTAFQPILGLADGGVVGVQALTRFVSDSGDEAGAWFAEAKDERLGRDLEFAALESALAAAQELPPHLFVALKLSAESCLDPLLPGLLEGAGIVTGRLVLEVPEATTGEWAAALLAALGPVRRLGVRLAIDHAGSYFATIGHIRQLRPDIIKLDRTLVACIDKDPLRSALVEAMVGFAEHIGADVVAQGLETPAELAAVSGLGVTAGQGYLLGRPTIRPGDWNNWTPAAEETRSRTGPDRRVLS